MRWLSVIAILLFLAAACRPAATPEPTVTATPSATPRATNPARPAATGSAAAAAALAGGAADLCGLKNAAWTIDGRLLRSARPEASAMPCLAAAGVTVILDQLPAGETDPAEAAAAERAGIEYVNLSLPDDTAPSPEILKQWIGTVNKRLAAGEVVLVHDAAGRGRIGFWEAVYLMYAGVSAERAIEDRYLAKRLPFDGAKIGCQNGGNGQVQALSDIAAALDGRPYLPQADEYGTRWQNCPRPDYMADWDYGTVLANAGG